VADLVSSTLPMATTDAQYEPNVKAMINAAIEDVPMIPLWQPTLEVAMQPGVSGYVNWFHRQLDIRSFTKK
jgi:peptide/nickel transport system substrate-binding protein